MVVGTLYLGTILSAIALFVYLVKKSSKFKKIAPLGRVYSSNIYFYHVACNYALCAICGVNLGKETSKPNNIIDDFFTEDLDEVTKILIELNVNKFKNYK